jgi:hypothetical protein
LIIFEAIQNRIELLSAAFPVATIPAPSSEAPSAVGLPITEQVMLAAPTTASLSPSPSLPPSSVYLPITQQQLVLLAAATTTPLKGHPTSQVYPPLYGPVTHGHGSPIQSCIRSSSRSRKPAKEQKEATQAAKEAEREVAKLLGKKAKNKEESQALGTQFEADLPFRSSQ